MQLNEAALNEEPLNGSEFLFFVRSADERVDVTDTQVLREFVFAYSDVLAFYDDLQSQVVPGGGGGGGTTYTNTVSDTLGLSDELLRFLRRMRASDDSLGAADERFASAYRNRSQDESATLTDGGFDVEWNVIAEDSATLSDELTRFTFRFRYIDDTLAVIDDVVKQLIGSGTTFTSTVEDFVSLIDENQRWLLIVRDVAETFGLSDELLRALLRARMSDDGIDVSDAGSYHVFRTRTAQDLITVIEEVVGTLSGSGVILSATVDDVVTLFDQALSYRLLTRASDDGIDVTDELLSYLRLFRYIDDALTTAEGLLYELAGGTTFSFTMSDTVLLIDGQYASAERGRVADDAITLTDAQVRIVQALRDIADSIELSDGFARILLNTRTIDDLIDLDDPFVSLYLPVITFVVRVRLNADPAPTVGVDAGVRLSADDNILLGSEV